LKNKLSIFIATILIATTMVVSVPLTASATERVEGIRNSSARVAKIGDGRYGRDRRGRWIPGHRVCVSWRRVYGKRICARWVWIPGHWSRRRP
jgi:hypothetical protein